MELRVVCLILTCMGRDAFSATQWNIAEGLLLDSFYLVDGTSGFLEILLGVLMNQTACCWSVSEKLKILVLNILLNIFLFANSTLINYHGV